MNSMENLRFDKEGYFNVLVFYGLFYRNKNNSSRVPPHVIETSHQKGTARASFQVELHLCIFFYFMLSVKTEGETKDDKELEG